MEVTGAPIRLQPLAGRRLDALGAPGETWLATLPSRLEELARRWELSLGRALPGGSASYVLAATTESGEPRVLKVALPGDSLAVEHAVLDAAAGQGYVRCLDYAMEHDALLLERLGPSLEHTPMPPGAKLDHLVDTLRSAWAVDLAEESAGEAGEAGEAGVGGKARELEQLVLELDARHPARAGRTCSRWHWSSPRDARATTRSPRSWCTAIRTRPTPSRSADPVRDRSPGGAFVDPDGFRCDPAYDLGVILRDWVQRLTDRSPEDARLLLRRWCLRVVERSGLGLDAVDRTWEWAFLERVSTGLYVTDFGAHELGARFLRSAAHLLD